MMLLLLACRPDPGAPHYPDPEPWAVTDDDDFYDDPLEAGEERLGIGVFYEGTATETRVIDDVDTHFYIYSATFTDTVTDDRWEGYVADDLVNTGVGWWGGGVHWDTPYDLSGWDTLHLVARSETLADWDLGITGGAEARVAVADYGMVADGEWYELEVPLADFAAAGADLTAVTVALMLIGDSGESGDTVTVDGVYFNRGLE